jgi:hypothetical protein
MFFLLLFSAAELSARAPNQLARSVFYPFTDTGTDLVLLGNLIILQGTAAVSVFQGLGLEGLVRIFPGDLARGEFAELPVNHEREGFLGGFGVALLACAQDASDIGHCTRDSASNGGGEAFYVRGEDSSIVRSREDF